MSDALIIAEKFFRAIEAGDVDAIRATYAPDAVIWHNNDQLEQSVDDNLRVLGWVVKNLKNRHYRVKRRVAIPGGFLQQHVLEAETANGPFAMPACIVVEIKDGRISRLDEYLDSGQTAALTKLAQGR
jgi:ketosteroid isomerase-like protein